MLLFLSCKCLVFGNGLTGKGEVGINVREQLYFASSLYATDQQSLHLEIYFNIFLLNTMKLKCWVYVPFLLRRNFSSPAYLLVRWCLTVYMFNIRIYCSLFLDIGNSIWGTEEIMVPLGIGFHFGYFKKFLNIFIYHFTISASQTENCNILGRY